MVTNNHEVNTNTSQLHSIRGIVESHDIKESGWWLFKKELPIISIRIDEKQLSEFNTLVRKTMSNFNGKSLPGIAPTLEIGMTKKDQAAHPIGAEVDITFHYAGPTVQFFLGYEPLSIQKMQVINNGPLLEN